MGISSSKHILVAPLSFSLTSPVRVWVSTKQIPQQLSLMAEGRDRELPPPKQQRFLPLPSHASPLLGKEQTLVPC